MAGTIVDKALEYFTRLEESEGEDIYIDSIPEPPVIELAMPRKDSTPKTESNPAKKTATPVNSARLDAAGHGNNVPPAAETLQKQRAGLSISPDWRDSASMEELNSRICNCNECRLGAGRKNFVFGTGNFDADIMVIGEAPGADEDEQGKPFVGRAGQLLTKILEAINLPREEVFIANIIKCRPPNNRRPNAEEVAKCEPYLQKQIDLIKPRFILSLGLTSVDTLLKKSHRMGDIRGSLMNYHGISMMVTYHPAALLRNPNWKKDTWEDVKKFRKLYDEYLETKSK